jgi:hypothetical protein
VPDASKPANEICSDRSTAGMIFSAKEKSKENQNLKIIIASNLPRLTR